jgi:hypothetical protein
MPISLVHWHRSDAALSKHLAVHLQHDEPNLP